MSSDGTTFDGRSLARVAVAARVQARLSRSPPTLRKQRVTRANAKDEPGRMRTTTSYYLDSEVILGVREAAERATEMRFRGQRWSQSLLVEAMLLGGLRRLAEEMDAAPAATTPTEPAAPPPGSNAYICQCGEVTHSETSVAGEPHPGCTFSGRWELAVSFPPGSEGDSTGGGDL